MISRCGLLKRKEGTSPEEFREYWYNTHGPIAAQMKNLRRYEQNVVVDNEQRSPFSRGPLEIDGFSELWFDNLYDMNEGVVSLDGAGAEDVLKFADPDNKILILCKHIVVPLPEYLQGRKLIKRVSLLGRKEGVSPEEFQWEWWHIHAALVQTMRGYVGYSQNIVLDRIVEGKSVSYEALPVEGIVEFWFEDMEGFENCYNTEEFKRCSEHGKAFISDITTYFVEARPYAL